LVLFYPIKATTFDIPVPGKTMIARETYVLLSVLILLTPLARAADHSDTRISRTITQNDEQNSNANEAVERYFEDEFMKKHETVAKYYEEEARKSRAKVKELEMMLAHYEEKSYLYGKKAQDLQAQTEALIRKHEEAAKADAREAASHRQIALTLKEKNHPASKTEKLSVVESYPPTVLSK
jgi:predicted ribosome quality control (RQC) complex YloA/Tae2 family protein